jgi:hypothetical protein
MAIQLDLLQTYDSTDILRHELENTNISVGNLRRGLFARYHELSKLYIKQQEEIEELRNMIYSKQCKAALHLES